MKTKIMLATFFMCILFSCKKKNEDVVITKKDYLIKASWKRIKFEIQNNAGVYVEQDLTIAPYN